MEEIFIDSVKIRPITILGYEYEDYKYSDIILLPLKYYDNVYTFNNELNVIKIKHNDIYTYGTIYNITEDEYIYVSIPIFHHLKHNCNVYETDFDIYLCNNLSKLDKVVLKPLTMEFFNVMNQNELFKNYIGDKYRILYNNLTFNIYSNEVKKELTFQVIIDDDTLIPAINTDLIVDFQPDEELVQKYEEKNNKINNLINSSGKISTKNNIIQEEDTEELSADEIRKRRLAFFNKK